MDIKYVAYFDHVHIVIPLIQLRDFGSMDVMTSVDLIDAHILPFFATEASTGEVSQQVGH